MFHIVFSFTLSTEVFSTSVSNLSDWSQGVLPFLYHFYFYYLYIFNVIFTVKNIFETSYHSPSLIRTSPRDSDLFRATSSVVVTGWFTDTGVDAAATTTTTTTTRNDDGGRGCAANRHTFDVGTPSSKDAWICIPSWRLPRMNPVVAQRAIRAIRRDNCFELTPVRACVSELYVLVRRRFLGRRILPRYGVIGRESYRWISLLLVFLAKVRSSLRIFEDSTSVSTWLLRYR